MKKSREESTGTWDEYFNTVLLILLETLADSDVSALKRDPDDDDNDDTS